MAKIFFYDAHSNQEYVFNNGIKNYRGYEDYTRFIDTEEFSEPYLIDFGKCGKFTSKDILNKLLMGRNYHYEIPEFDSMLFPNEKYMIGIQFNEFPMARDKIIRSDGKINCYRFKMSYYSDYTGESDCYSDINLCIEIYKNFSSNKYEIVQPIVYYTGYETLQWDKITADGIIVLRPMLVEQNFSEMDHIKPIINKFIFVFGSYLFNGGNDKLKEIFKAIETQKANYRKAYSYYDDYNDYDDGSYEREERELIERSVEHLDDAYEEGYR